MEGEKTQQLPYPVKVLYIQQTGKQIEAIKSKPDYFIIRYLGKLDQERWTHELSVNFRQTTLQLFASPTVDVVIRFSLCKTDPLPISIGNL